MLSTLDIWSEVGSDDFQLPEVLPEAGTPVADPGQAQVGNGGQDSRSKPGTDAASQVRPSGTGGVASGGGGPSMEDENKTTGTGRGSPKGHKGGKPGDSDKRGIKGGGGDLELPEWLSWIDTALDGAQTGLDVVGMIPGLGEIADGLNGLLSLIRGDYAGAALSFAAMIPFAGWAATAGKFGRKAVGAIAGSSSVVSKYGDDVAQAARKHTKSSDSLETMTGTLDPGDFNSRHIPIENSTLPEYSQMDFANMTDSGYEKFFDVACSPSSGAMVYATAKKGEYENGELRELAKKLAGPDFMKLHEDGVLSSDIAPALRDLGLDASNQSWAPLQSILNLVGNENNPTIAILSVQRQIDLKRHPNAAHSVVVDYITRFDDIDYVAIRDPQKPLGKIAYFVEVDELINKYKGATIINY